jgi:MoxR-like ATPase
MNESADALHRILEKIQQEISKVIIGHQEVVDRALIAVFSGSHALIEGVPGVAKTLLVRTLAHVMQCDFARIQFTPDLMPSDITGTYVFNLQKQSFFLAKGPIFTTFLLADEINRAPAKTQSALLQAMQERAVTIDRRTHRLSENFTVFATQNPIEYEGTYPLPEAQKDRFMLKISMNHPQREEERLLARRMLGEQAPERVLAGGGVKKVLTPEHLLKLRAGLQTILVKEELLDYIVSLVRRTRKNPAVLVGAGPRGTQALLLAARCYAALAGRRFVTPDDIKEMALPVLEHRVMLRPEYEIEGLKVREVIDAVLKEVPVPK